MPGTSACNVLESCVSALGCIGRSEMRARSHGLMFDAAVAGVMNRPAALLVRWLCLFGNLARPSLRFSQSIIQFRLLAGFSYA